jgi:AcrR family transcriptional regulator
VIADRGYAAATTNVIARRAGVSVGSLYQYFPNKVAILVSLLERHIHEVQPVIQRGLALLADPETPFEEALRRLFLQLVAAHDHSPRLHEVLSEEVPHPPSIQRLRQKLEGDYVRQAAEILRSRPDVHAERCDVAAQVLVIVAEAMTYWLSHAAPRSVDRRLYVDEAVRLLGLYVSRRCP